jgi:hypothetical protein
MGPHLTAINHKLASAQLTSSNDQVQDDNSPPRHLAVSLRIPPELISLILTFTQDWELATTLGVRTSLPKPAPWVEFATRLDWAILRSSTSTNPVRYAIEVASVDGDNNNKFTQWGARVMLRFGYVHVLDYFSLSNLNQLKQECKQLLPVVASAWGRTSVLEWAQKSKLGLKPDSKTTAEAIDEASRHGQVQVLDFWRNSGLPLSKFFILLLLNLEKGFVLNLIIRFFLSFFLLLLRLFRSCSRFCDHQTTTR